jgi:hypothetical protein
MPSFHTDPQAFKAIVATALSELPRRVEWHSSDLALEQNLRGLPAQSVIEIHDTLFISADVIEDLGRSVMRNIFDELAADYGCDLQYENGSAVFRKGK